MVGFTSMSGISPTRYSCRTSCPEKLSPFEEQAAVLGPAPNPECQPAWCSSSYSDLSEAISMEKRYFTSDLSSLS